ncbi:MAG: hypothetical protein R3E02_09945 [Blastomonas sp.]
MAARLSQAERWRQHRKEMEYAMAHGCTPREAAERMLGEEMAERIARLKDREAALRSRFRHGEKAESCPPQKDLQEPPQEPIHEGWDARWMMRD